MLRLFLSNIENNLSTSNQSEDLYFQITNIDDKILSKSKTVKKISNGSKLDIMMDVNVEKEDLDHLELEIIKPQRLKKDKILNKFNLKEYEPDELNRPTEFSMDFANYILKGLLILGLLVLYGVRYT